MKKLVTFLGLGLIISTLAFAYAPDVTYLNVENDYPEICIELADYCENGGCFQTLEEAQQSLLSIYAYAKEYNKRLTWEIVKGLIDNPTDFE